MRIFRAPAKINLFLEVTGRRSDGYHELQTVMQTVSLYDTLGFKITTKKIEINPYIPRNTVSSAVRKVFRYCKIKQGISIDIKKSIPIGAGLGGGSSDAAVTINALDELFKLGLSIREKLEIAGSIGSDCPFFIKGGTALCLSRGDVVVPIRLTRNFNFVLVTLPLTLLTKDVYGAFSLTRSFKDVIRFIKCLNTDLFKLGRGLFNRLEGSAVKIMPEIMAVKHKMEQTGFMGVCMSGSGPSLFGLCESYKEARKKAQILKKELTHCKVFCVDNEESM